MFILKLIKTALSLSAIITFTNCSKDHAILSPNDPCVRKPLFTISAMTSYQFFNAKKLAQTSGAPMDMMQASTNPVIMMLWVRDSGRKDTFYCQTSQTSTGWPLCLRADLYDVPDPKNLQLVPGTTDSKIGAAGIILVNDADRDGQLKIWDAEVARMVRTRDSLKSCGLSDSLMQDSINNYGLFKGSKSKQEWWMGIASSASILYLSDSVALKYVIKKLQENPNPEAGNYLGEGLKVGYNIMQLINPHFEMPCDTVDYGISCEQRTFCDNIVRLKENVNVNIALFTNWNELENTHTYGLPLGNLKLIW